MHKRKKAFNTLIDETPYVTLTSTWEEARELIKDDPRFERFGRDDRCGCNISDLV